jgi:uncharacterized protein (TIGR00725 family)
MRRPIVGIFGAADASDRSLTHARELGRFVAQQGWIVLTGGRPEGVMAAACAGAKTVSGSVTVGILPSAGTDAAADVDIAIYTGLGDARNVVNVLSSNAIVACGVEGPGTASEVAHALKARKPVILLAPDGAALAFFRGLPGGNRILEANSVPDAVRLLGTPIGLPAMPAFALP